MRRWRWTVATALVVAGGWVVAAEAGPAKVYVANEEGDSVTVTRTPCRS